MKVSRFFLPLLSSMMAVYGQVTIIPETPVCGETMEVRLNLDRQQGGFRVGPGEVVYAEVAATVRGLVDFKSKTMHRDGSALFARFAVPEHAVRVRYRVITTEHVLRQGTLTPLTGAGQTPPGALILGMNQGGHSRANWEADVRAEFERDPQMWWAYHELWGMRFVAMRNISPDELRAEISRLESEPENPELLSSLAYGRWLVGEERAALDKLTILCERHPRSPYTVRALHDAFYKIHSDNLTEAMGEWTRLMTGVLNRAPENPGFQQEGNLRWWIERAPEITADSAQLLFKAWSAQKPEDGMPFQVLALVLGRQEGRLEEAERLLTHAIDLGYRQPVAPDVNFNRARLLALPYRDRCQLRLRLGHLAGALEDALLAQQYNSFDREKDVASEARIWKEMGFLSRAEERGLEAYRLGAADAEAILKEIYVLQGGEEKELHAYLRGRLVDTASESEKGLTPQFEVVTLEGKKVGSDALKGSFAVLNFWFTTCGPCVGEIPRLNELVREFQGKVRFLAISTIDDENRLRDFLKNKAFSYEIVPHVSGLADRFTIRGCPTHVILDPDGKIIFKAQGGSPENIERIRSYLLRGLERKSLSDAEGGKQK
ncbi:MAG: TlpA family protein disulfide reductase [Acidobacteria bacterium]|nr:MAG: TlpA family protein disulfide reductase [Acidobacteriota bacterium]